MKHPVFALVWQCWRMTRRWYLLIMLIAVAFQLALMNISAPHNYPPGFPFRELMATTAFVVNFTLAVFTTLFAITVGGRAGFPLRFEFRLPVSSRMLVAVPMVYLSAVCASLYVVPVLLSRLFYGIPYPFAPAAMVLATLVTALATASWSVTGSNSRTVAIIVAGLGLIQVFTRIDPLNVRTAFKPGEPVFHTDIIALTPLDYGVLALLCLVLYVFCVHRVSLERYGEGWQLPGRRQRKPVVTNTAVVAVSRSSTLFEQVSDFFAIPCPVGSPWRAEFWLELKRYGMPLLVLGVICALGVPLLLLVARWQDWPGLQNLVWIAAVAIFFFGIGFSFLNRRQGSGGYMNAFEGTRGMGTLTLAGIQFVSMAVCSAAGILLVMLALSLSSPLIEQSGIMIARMLNAATAFSNAALAVQASVVVVVGVMYLALIAVLALVHACSVFWGRKVLYGMVVFVLYCIVFTFGVSNGNVELDNIKHHMWGFAGLMLLLALLAAGRVLYLKLLSWPAGIAVLLSWLVFVVCAWYSLAHMDVDLLHQASELQAFNAALLSLPLTLFLLTAWSYDHLRHR